MAQGFDPAAATAAYLAQLPPEAHARAQAYTQGGHWLLLWGAVVSVAAAWLILRSGLTVRVRTAVEAKRPRPWLAVLAVLAVHFVAEFVLTLPWAIYSDWWRETQPAASRLPASVGRPRSPWKRSLSSVGTPLSGPSAASAADSTGSGYIPATPFSSSST